MLVALVPLLVPQLQIRLTEASIGRREYAIELHVESEKGETMTESATIAERLVRRFSGFERTRYVVGSAIDDGAPTFKPGTRDSDLLSPNGIGQRKERPRVPLFDISFPDGPLTPRREWKSIPFENIPLVCRYEGDVSIAGRTAARVSFRVSTHQEGLTINEAHTLIDRADARPLQTYVRAEIDFFSKAKVLFRLRRTNVPGLGLPR